MEKGGIANIGDFVFLVCIVEWIKTDKTLSSQPGDILNLPAVSHFTSSGLSIIDLGIVGKRSCPLK